MRTAFSIVKGIIIVSIFLYGIFFAFVRIDSPIRTKFFNAVIGGLDTFYQEQQLGFEPCNSYPYNRDSTALKTEEVERKLQTAKTSQVMAERCEAISSLANSNYRDRDRVIEFLISNASDLTPGIRGLICRTLGHYDVVEDKNAKVVIPVMGRFLKDEKESIRIDAVAGLEQLAYKDKSAITVLKEANNDPNIRIRLEAIKNIIKHEPNDDDAHSWLKELYDQNPDKRWEIISDLYSKDQVKSLPLLIDAAKSTDIKLKAAAVEKLVTFLGVKPEVKELLVLAASDPLVEVRKAAATGVKYSLLEDPDLKKLKEKLAADPNQEIRDLLAPPTKTQLDLYSDKAPMPKGIVAELRVDKSEFVIGHPEVVSYCVKNEGGQPFKFAEGGDYRGYRPTRFQVTAEFSDGSSVVDPMPFVFSTGGMLGQYDIAPEAVHCLPVAIFRYLLVEKPGKYIVTIYHDLGYTETAENSWPRAKKEISFRLPTKEEANQFVSDLMAEYWNRKDSTFRPKGSDIQVLRSDLYLSSLDGFLKDGREEVIDGIASIETIDATKSLIFAALSDKLNIRKGALPALFQRIPILGPEMSTAPFRFRWDAENRGRLAARTWSPELKPSVIILSKKLLAAVSFEDQCMGAELALAMNEQQLLDKVPVDRRNEIIKKIKLQRPKIG